MVLYQERNRDRLKSAAGVAAFHALLGYALITGLGFELPGEVADKLQVFDVVEPPPPPPVEKPVPAKVRVEAPEGAASPPSMKSNPTPIVAPPPRIQLKVPPPVVSVPEPTPVPEGTAPTAGVAAIPGPGTGTGGEGNGTGAGGQGSGTGGGGAGSPARWISGRIRDSDYPRSAVRARASGTVFLRFVVAPSGRVSDCRVTRTSGNRDLDETTCELIVRRFRYRPAIDEDGRPIAQTIRGEHDWELAPEPEPIEIEPTEIDDR
jgi:protein TonB